MRPPPNFLEDSGIAFQYEYPLAIKDRGLVRLWYPDFKLPEYDTIIEYFGMNGNKAYNEQMAHKIQAYKEADQRQSFLPSGDN